MCNYMPVGGFQGVFSVISPDAQSVSLGNINIISKVNTFGAFNNPALLIDKKYSGGISYHKLSLDRYNQSIILSFRIPPKATGSIGYTSSGVKDIIGRGYTGNITNEFNWSSHHGFFCFGISPLNKVSIGVKFNIFFQNLIDEVKSTGLGIDLGVHINPVNNLSMAFTLKNIKGKSNWKISMDDGTIRDYNEYYPLIYSGALSYTFLGQFNFLGQMDFYHDIDFGFIGYKNKFGVEYHINNFNSPLYLRVGYNINNASIGIKLPLKKILKINYALVIGLNNEGNSHVFTWDYNL